MLATLSRTRADRASSRRLGRRSDAMSKNMNASAFSCGVSGVVRARVRERSRRSPGLSRRHVHVGEHHLAAALPGGRSFGVVNWKICGLLVWRVDPPLDLREIDRGRRRAAGPALERDLAPQVSRSDAGRADGPVPWTFTIQVANDDALRIRRPRRSDRVRRGCRRSRSTSRSCPRPAAAGLPPPLKLPPIQMLCQCDANTRPPRSAYAFIASSAACGLVLGFCAPSHDRITMSYCSSVVDASPTASARSGTCPRRR